MNNYTCLEYTLYTSNPVFLVTTNLYHQFWPHLGHLAKELQPRQMWDNPMKQEPTKEKRNTLKKYMKKGSADRHKEDRLQLDGSWKKTQGRTMGERDSTYIFKSIIGSQYLNVCRPQYYDRVQLSCLALELVRHGMYSWGKCIPQAQV